MSAEFNLELLNGNWAIAALALAVISAVYLAHEAISREVHGHGWRQRLTTGMRVATAVLALSIGVAVRSIETWRWRLFGGDLDQMWLTVGGIIAIVGFLCLIREISMRLFGRAPWLWTMAAMALFNVISLIVHFR